MAETPEQSSREHARVYRRRMREQGMRLFQIWVPDTRAPGFAEEARHQSLAVSQSPQAQEDLDWTESIADIDED